MAYAGGAALPGRRRACCAWSAIRCCASPARCAGCCGCRPRWWSPSSPSARSGVGVPGPRARAAPTLRSPEAVGAARGRGPAVRSARAARAAHLSADVASGGPVGAGRDRLDGDRAGAHRCSRRRGATTGGSARTSAFLGMVAVGVPVAAGPAAATVPSQALAGNIDAERLVAREEAAARPACALADRTRWMRRIGFDRAATRRRVALLAVGVGEQLGLTPGRLRRLALGALLHDIGKLRVPAAILRQAGRPRRQRSSTIIRRHTDWGDQLAGELGFAAAHAATDPQPPRATRRDRLPRRSRRRAARRRHPNP